MSAGPPPIDDPVFGRLEWEDEEALLGEIEYDGGRHVAVFIVADLEEIEPADVVGNAREAFLRFLRNERHYRLLSGRALNGRRWNREARMADEDVANLLRIASLDFDPAGGLAVYWDDGDLLFAGHHVVTRIGPDGAFLDARMQ
jgi:hypothetical protein